jgi:uncharacterized membrane protein
VPKAWHAEGLAQSVRQESAEELLMKRGYLSALGMGVVAGVRSMTAPALVSRYVKRGDLGSLGSFLTSGLVSRALQAGAAAEMAADKTSWVPDRTSAPSLAWRALSGGVVGSVVAGSAGESRAIGALLGASAAVGAAYGIFYLRQALTRRLHVPDRLVGAAEDSLAVGAGRRLLVA